jgi:RNA polymerase sigma factor (sigma-70 family)
VAKVSPAQCEPVARSIDENFARYYREVGQTEMIDAATERKLFWHYKYRKSLAARDRIIENCLRFVIKLARRYTHDMDTLKDLIAAGNEGLLFALGKYDLKYNTRFLSYATHYVLLYIRSEIHNSGLVAMPLWRQKTIRKVQRAKNRSVSSSGCPPELEEICSEAEITPAQFEKLRVEKFHYSPIDHVCVPTNGNESHAINQQAKDALNKLLLGLGSKEQFVLRSYYGLVADPMSLKQIANVLGVSSERVRQLKVAALNYLRRVMGKNFNINSADDIVAIVY